MMLNFGGVLDPSASFPGLGELPSNGMEPGVEQNLTGTFTGDLNSTAYEVEDQDHSRLLQEMLQQHPQPSQPAAAARMPDAQVHPATLQNHPLNHILKWRFPFTNIIQPLIPRPKRKNCFKTCASLRGIHECEVLGTHP